MSLRTNEYAQGFNSPVASNPDISGIGVRIASYAHIAVTLVLLSSFRNEAEHFRAAGRRIHILSIMLAIASIWQSSTAGLSPLDTTSTFAIQLMMGMYGSILMCPEDNRQSGPDFTYRGWWAAYISWVMVAPVRFEMLTDLLWFWIIVKAPPYVFRYGRIVARRFGWKRDECSDPSGIKPSTSLLIVYLLSMMVFVELKVYINVEAKDLNQWTYGQILPMLLLSLPMFELLSEVWKLCWPSSQATRDEPASSGAGMKDPALGNIP